MIDSRKFIKLRSAYSLAIRGNKEDKYRKGNLIELPPNGDIIILGDLHGNQENFQKVVAAADLESHPDRHLILQEPTHTYEVSEDRSFLLIDEIAHLKSKFPNHVHLILGNHELSEITGKEILKGGICYNILFIEGMKKEYGHHFSTIRELMLEFMQTMALGCLLPNRIFVSHSTPMLKYIPWYSLKFFREGSGDPNQDKLMIEKLVWGRDLSQNAADAFATRVRCETLIVGHTACKRGYQVPNSRHIVLDSKGVFGTSLHFRMNRCYTQQHLVKKSLQYINKKAVKKLLAKYKEQKQAQKT